MGKNITHAGLGNAVYCAAQVDFVCSLSFYFIFLFAVQDCLSLFSFLFHKLIVFSFQTRWCCCCCIAEHGIFIFVHAAPLFVFVVAAVFFVLPAAQVNCCFFHFPGQGSFLLLYFFWPQLNCCFYFYFFSG